MRNDVDAEDPALDLVYRQRNAVERGAGEGDPKNSNQECAMAKWKMLTAVVIAAGLMFGAQNVQAHCDSLDGPVAKAVHKALETGNVNLVLVYAPAKAEAEIRASFEKSRKVRGLGRSMSVTVRTILH